MELIENHFVDFFLRCPERDSLFYPVAELVID